MLPYVIITIAFIALLGVRAHYKRVINDMTASREKERQCIKDKLSDIRCRERKVEEKLSEVEEKLSEANCLMQEYRQAPYHRANLEHFLASNLTAMPWLAGMIADYLTFDIEMQAKCLEWGSDQKRLKKVASIRAIRSEAKQRIAEAKEAIYQLEYLKELYPGLEDVLNSDYKELNFSGTIPEHDPTRDYLSSEEWKTLSSIERDQLALDRYVQSHSKSNWQIGRDYELSVAYEYLLKGYSVDTFGSRKGLEDLGRDLICTGPDRTLIIQCKYWSKEKTIHEKHIFQLYGTATMYRIDHPSSSTPILALFVTNTRLSDTARKAAVFLGITVVENHNMVEFPRIKCNIGRGEFGEVTKIYHLPMDIQYDVTQIKNAGEFYAMTVQEAVNAGFRRAFKWHGTGQD